MVVPLSRHHFRDDTPSDRLLTHAVEGATMLGKLFSGLTKKSASSHVAPLSSALAETILSTVGQRAIPPMPGAAQKAFKLATDPKAEARDFVEVIESDEGLSARIIKIANSVFFDRGHQTKTIEDAVVVIGINELRCLLNANTLSDIFPSKHSDRALLWGHDIAVALVARTLAQRRLPAQSDAAFLAGLMHDIGKLLLLQRLTDEYGKILRAVEQQGKDSVGIEEEKLLFSHVDVGQLIAERWKFTPELTRVIKLHHRPPGEDDPLVLIIYAADGIAHALGLGHSPAMRKLRSYHQERLPEIFERLSIGAADQKDLLESAQRTFETEYQLYAGRAQ